MNANAQRRIEAEKSHERGHDAYTMLSDPESRKKTLEFFDRLMNGIEAETELQGECQHEYEVAYTFNAFTFQPHTPYLKTTVYRCKKCGHTTLAV